MYWRIFSTLVSFSISFFRTIDYFFISKLNFFGQGHKHVLSLYTALWDCILAFKSEFRVRGKFRIEIIKTTKPLFSTLSPRNGFSPFSQKITAFLKKLLNNKIFNISFVIKKIMLIFGARRLLSLKNCQMRPQNSFSRFSQKILLFLKKLSNKKIFSI